MLVQYWLGFHGVKVLGLCELHHAPCNIGLRDHKTAQHNAGRIMLEVPVVQPEAAPERANKQRV
jgi:hypothetical protein